MVGFLHLASNTQTESEHILWIPKNISHHHTWILAGKTEDESGGSEPRILEKLPVFLSLYLLSSASKACFVSQTKWLEIPQI